MRAATLCSTTILLLFIRLGQGRSLVNADSTTVFIGCDNLKFDFKKCNNSYPIICVSEAIFKRTGRNTCPNNENGMENTTCTNNNVLRYMRDMCHGNRSCKFTLSSKAMGNHCEGAFKYIVVTINCVKLKCKEKEMNVVAPPNGEDSEPKTINILPSFSSPTTKHGYGSPSAIFPTNNNLQASFLKTQSQQTFQTFPARRPRPSQRKGNWVDTTGNASVPVFATSSRSTGSKKTCSSSRKTGVPPTSRFSSPAIDEGRNGCGKLSMHFLLKIVLFGVGFVV